MPLNIALMFTALFSALSIDRLRNLQEFRLQTLLEAGLPDHASVRVRVRWPLYFLPFIVLNQLLTPHPVWVVLFVALTGLYGVAIYWMRSHARHVTLMHRRLGEQLVVGDTFEEEFEIRNNHLLPVLWVELEDQSRFPSNKTGQVAACGGHTNYRWRRAVACRQRGVYRLGPYALAMSDPFGLLELRLGFEKEEVIVIYPRVVQLATGKFPHGQSTGADRRRRSILGATPAYSVQEYQPGDSLRRVHWRVTAHRGRLMVRELETEPTGDIWIVLDLHAGAQQGEGTLGTLEFGIVVASSLAASLLTGGEGRAVGLLAHSGAPDDSTSLPTGHEIARPISDGSAIGFGPVSVRPKAGSAQLWQILTALAPVQAGNVSLGELIAGSREFFGGQSTLIIVTPQVYSREQLNRPGTKVGTDGKDFDGTNGTGAGPQKPADYWPAELLHMRSSGLDAYAVLVAPHPSSLAASTQTQNGTHDAARLNVGEAEDSRRIAQNESGLHGGVEVNLAEALHLQELLMAQRVGTEILEASDAYLPLLTYRRKRTIARTTPSGGVVLHEINEEVS